MKEAGDPAFQLETMTYRWDSTGIPAGPDEDALLPWLEEYCTGKEFTRGWGKDILGHQAAGESVQNRIEPVA